MGPKDLPGPVAQQAAEPGAIKLAYDFRGSGPPLVFVHGLTFDRASWQPIIDRLADAYRCIAVDLPGHGDSDGPPRPLEDIAAALHRLLDEAGIDRPVVVGHSMGVPVVCIYAAAYPVRGVVDVDQSLFVRPFAELVHSLAPGLRGDDFGTTPAQLQARIDNIAPAIRAPFLAVFGHVLDAHDKQHLRRFLPSAQVEEWPDRGHLVHLAEPDRFAARLAAFASQCFAPSQPNRPTAPSWRST